MTFIFGDRIAEKHHDDGSGWRSRLSKQMDLFPSNEKLEVPIGSPH